MTAVERLPIQSRLVQRAKRVQTLQHVFAAVALASAGWEHLHHGHGGLLLPSLEIAGAALLLGAAAREHLRRGHGHDAVGWVEIAGGVMTLIEAITRTRERHHLSFLVLAFLQPLVLFAFGIFDVQLNSMRYLEANNTHFVVRLRLLFRRSLLWDHARGFRFRGDRLEVDTTRHRRGFSLRNVINIEPAKAFIREQFGRRGIAELASAEELPGGER
jgi:hypothetical protein